MVTTSEDSTEKTTPLAGSRAGIILYSIIAVISLIGLADATYLTVTHLTGDDLVCGPGGCSAVLGSVYASVAGIPTAAFGVLGYFAVFSSATLAAFGYARARGFLALIVAGMFAATLGLLYLQAFVLHAFCPFCLLSAALVFLLAGIVIAIPSSR
jgi:uncharacterized membrane protein